MHLIFFILFTSVLQAREVAVNYKLFSYKVNYDEKSIIYTAPNTELSIREKPCNKHIIKDFHTKMNAALRGNFLTPESSETYSIEFDKIKKYDLLISKRGLFFGNFDQYFKTLKVDEALSCKKVSAY